MTGGRVDRRRFLRATAAALGVAATMPDWPALANLGMVRARTARAEPLVWERTGFRFPTNRLFAPRSGALFAVPGEGKRRTVTEPPVRSDDGGFTWRSAGNVPPDERVRPRYIGITVDPVDHAIMYALGMLAVYKSEDAAETWRVVDSLENTIVMTQMVLEVSPADHHVIYVAEKTNNFNNPPEFWWVRRSDDGGATWQEAERREGRGISNVGISAFFPHPTDPDRVFRAVGAFGRSIFGHSLELSVDRGQTWTTVVASGEGEDAFYPESFSAGPDGVLYLGGSRDDRRHGAIVMTGDASGETWTPRIVTPQVSGGTTDVVWHGCRGVAADPTRPGRAYAALNGFKYVAGNTVPTPVGVVLKRTDDGGKTWSEVGSGDPGVVHDIAVGVDGRHLFAATWNGVWRLPLD